MRTSYILAGIAFLAIAATAHADPASPSDAPAAASAPPMQATTSPDAPVRDAAAAPAESPPPEVPTKPLSVSRRTTGQVLVVLGLAHIVAGGAVWGYAASQASGGNCEFCGFYFVAILPLLISGGAMTAVGIPLWVTGAKKVPVSHALGPVRNDPDIAELYVPRLSIGAGSVGLTVPF